MPAIDWPTSFHPHILPLILLAGTIRSPNVSPYGEFSLANRGLHWVVVVATRR